MTPLQGDFLRALHWYRKGRWEPDPDEQFSLYRIGLEHLFARNEAKPELFKKLPQLHITWRQHRRLDWVGHSLQEARRQIEGNETLRVLVEQHPELQGRQNELRLLEHDKVAVLWTLIPADMELTRMFFSEFLTDLQGVAADTPALTADVEALRAQLRFRLHLLYNLRNTLFHEARATLDALEMYVEELESVFEDVLKKMASQAVTPSAQCIDIDRLTKLLQRPWI